MSNEVKLNQLLDLLKALEYPLSRDEARKEVDDVTLLYADGEEALAAVIARSNERSFETPGDLEAEVYANLPVEAVGEPGQSEGEG